MDKFIVKSNITSNKLQNFETVSRRSRHRSNHTQKNIPSVVAGHQFLQFVALARTMEYFLSLVIHPGFCLKTDQKIHFHRTAFSGSAACLWWLLNCVLWKLFIFQKILQGIAHATWKRMHNFHFSAIVLQLTIIIGKGDITKVTGSLTAPDRFRMLVGFSSELTGALFSAFFLYQGSMKVSLLSESIQRKSNYFRRSLVFFNTIFVTTNGKRDLRDFNEVWAALNIVFLIFCISCQVFDKLHVSQLSCVCTGGDQDVWLTQGHTAHSEWFSDEHRHIWSNGPFRKIFRWGFK